MTRLATLVLLFAAAAAAAGCSSDGGSRTGGSSESSASPSAGTPSAPVAHGATIRVTYHNYIPDKFGRTGTWSLVNASSDLGQRLRSGRATSAETHVVEDEDMGRVLDGLRQTGFFNYARPGIGFDEIADRPGLKGVIVLEQNGASQAFESASGGRDGTAATAFRDSKILIVDAHGKLEGYAIKVGQGDSDPNTFESPGIQPRVRKP